MAIEITDRAVDEIRRLLEQEGISVGGLRVGVKGGGCSGFSYVLDLTENERDSDEITEQHGVRIVCDPKSLIYLDNTTIDFKDEIMGRGFVFSNPNATSSCGCGSSFSA